MDLKKLDYSIKDPAARKELVEEIVRNASPNQLTEKYIEILSNYIIMAMDKDEKKKKREAEKEAKAIQLKIKNLEKTISEKEVELLNLQEQLCLESVYSNPIESQRVNGEIKELEDTIAKLYEEWEDLA